MNRKDLYCAFREVDDDILERSEAVVQSHKKAAWLKWGVLAACLCLTMVRAAQIFMPDTNDGEVLEVSGEFEAANGFHYGTTSSDGQSAKSIADSAIPYAQERYFSDFRSQMEAEGVIPDMPDHPLYTCIARYNEDGSIFSVTFSWHQRGDTYSDLSITAAYQEVEMPQCCIEAALDECGNIIPPAVTVTEWDGIQIVAEGGDDQNKTITFQKDTVWYQIAGSWGDSCKAMERLLDWLWEHPIDFSLFTMDMGDEIVHTTLAESPDAFASHIPDFEALGYVQGDTTLSLKNGEPYRFEGHFYSGVEEALVEAGSYLFEDGWSEIHWCVDAGPDYYELQECLGDISLLTEQMIADTLSEKSSFSFTLDGCYIRVYCKNPAQAWAAVASLTE